MIYDILLYLLFMMRKLIFKKMIYSLFKTYKKKNKMYRNLQIL